jgi:SAM-dependent methyltransferase
MPSRFASRLYCASLFLGLLHAVPVHASGPQQHGDDTYRPFVGQDGKDVVWVPTPDDLVHRMLDAAQVKATDTVIDLGAGDGKIAIAAARQFGARAIGIEYNPRMAALAQRNAQRAGVADRVTIIHGDIFREDFSSATVVTMYLLPDLNLRLKPTLLAMTPGTRILSHSFTLGSWEPDEVITGSDGRRGYLWQVPARIQGRWRLEGLPEGIAELEIAQQFQKFKGTVRVGGRQHEITEGVVRGPDISFRFSNASGDMRSISATVDGTRFSAGLANTTAKLSGSRLP